MLLSAGHTGSDLVGDQWTCSGSDRDAGRTNVLCGICGNQATGGDMNNDRAMWLAQTVEEPIDPELPICDPHHHFWDRPHACYLLDELIEDTSGGHRI